MDGTSGERPDEILERKEYTGRKKYRLYTLNSRP